MKNGFYYNGQYYTGIGKRKPKRRHPVIRIKSTVNWELVEFVLTIAVMAYIAICLFEKAHLDEVSKWNFLYWLKLYLTYHGII